MNSDRPNGRPRKKLSTREPDTVNGDGVNIRPWGGTLADALPQMCAAIAAGATIGRVCALAGFSRQALYTWRQRYPEHDAMVRKAEAIRDSSVEDNTYQAAQTDWQAGFKWLAIHRPDDWTPPSHRVEMTGKGGGPIVVAGKRLDELTDAELAAEARKLAEELE